MPTGAVAKIVERYGRYAFGANSILLEDVNAGPSTEDPRLVDSETSAFYWAWNMGAWDFGAPDWIEGDVWQLLMSPYKDERGIHIYTVPAGGGLFGDTTYCRQRAWKVFDEVFFTEDDTEMELDPGQPAPQRPVAHEWGGHIMVGGPHGMMGNGNPYDGTFFGFTHNNTFRTQYVMSGPGDAVTNNPYYPLQVDIRRIWDTDIPMPPTQGKARMVGYSSNGGAIFDVGVGWNEIPSNVQPTYRLPVIGNAFQFDVFVPSGEGWPGTIQMEAGLPAAGVWNTYLGQVDLSTLERDVWQTVSFPIPSALRNALNGDYPGADIRTFANTNLTGVLIRNLRTQEQPQGTPQRTPHTSTLSSVITNEFLSFEDSSDWAGTNVVGRSRATDGVRSIGLETGGWAEVESREFSSLDLPTVTDTLAMDVFVPNPLPNPYWIGSVQAYLSCPDEGVWGQYLGEADLTYRFTGEWNTVTFPLHSWHQDALASGSDCRIRFTINTQATGATGQFYFDRVGFVN